MTNARSQTGISVTSRLLLPALAFVCLIWTTGIVEAATQRFDGNWSIYIYGSTTGCTFRYRLPITVRNGDILYKGSRVHPTVIGLNSSGSVAINLGSGASAVTGSGALSTTRGSGRWSAPRYRCNGWWRAEKR